MKRNRVHNSNKGIKKKYHYELINSSEMSSSSDDSGYETESDTSNDDSNNETESSEYESRSEEKENSQKMNTKAAEKIIEDNKEGESVWEWWREPRSISTNDSDKIKWKTLEHNGPLFPPQYESLPKYVDFKYNGRKITLSKNAEEVAGFYSRLIDHNHTKKEIFNQNFLKIWQEVMSITEQKLIKDLTKCNFQAINEYYKQKSEEKKMLSQEEKQKIKIMKDTIQNEYGMCTVDGHKERIGNYRIEPPGLFIGRGEHPKMGMLKKRIQPEDVIINCSLNSKIPNPPLGHVWKEIRHDTQVSWLASWTEEITNKQKYIWLNSASKLKGKKDWLKYEKARELAKHIEKIRTNYFLEFHSKDMKVRQRAIAMYFIDKLSLRAGNEKDEEETADTVGCCSLRYEHIKLQNENSKVEFNFLGKDSIPYKNTIDVEKPVFQILENLLKKKTNGDALFDDLNTTVLNKHLSKIMNGLTSKVFRTYNASHVFQHQLNVLTPKNGNETEKLMAYNSAGRIVATLCNHQRTPPKTYEITLKNIENKIKEKRKYTGDLKKEIQTLEKNSKMYIKKSETLKKMNEMLKKCELQLIDKEEGREITLSTSKLNYLDPRISVAWCLKWNIPIEKIYNKTQREKFRWAIMGQNTTEHFKFD